MHSMAGIKFQKKDELSSTERLLETIRDADGGDGVKVAPAKKYDSAGDLKTITVKQLKTTNTYKKKSVNIGVSLGYDRAFFLVSLPLKDNQWKIIDYRELLFKKGMTLDDPQFPIVLGNFLENFTQGYAKAQIWSFIPSVDVEIRQIKIPKLANNKISDAVYWTFRKDSKFDEELYIFDYEVIGNIIENGVEKIEVIAYSAPRKDIENREELFLAAGFPLTGITVMALAFQNYLGLFQKKGIQQNSCLLFIGRDWARIDIYTDGFITLSRDIKTGYLSLVMAVTDAVNQNRTVSAKDSSSSLQDISLVSAESVEQFMMDELYKRKSSKDFKQIMGITEIQIEEMISPVLNRLAKQIDRTLEFFKSNYNQYPVEKIYVSGLVSGSERFMHIFAEKVSHPIIAFDPFKADGPIDYAVKSPELMVVKDQFAPVLCVSLAADADKFNFCNTRKKKIQKKYVKTVNYSVTVVFVLVMLCCCGYHSWQKHFFSVKKQELVELNSNLDNYFTTVDQDSVSELATEVIQKTARLKSYIKRYFTMALICELTKLTPPDIYLEKFSIKPSEIGNGADFGETMSIKGIVIGKEIALESILAEFILNLSASPLIKNKDASVIEKKFDILRGQKIIRFTAVLETVNG